MQEFFINKDSINPVLEMELIYDGRYDFEKSLINDALQDSIITFSMYEETTGLLKVSKAKANIVLGDTDNSEEKYILQYKWKPKDVNKCGIYNGIFEITFNNNISSNGSLFPSGNLKVPIENELKMIVK